MKKLLTEGQYFSEESMKNRDPLLYERMVGKYLSTEQIKRQSDAIGASLSGIFLSHIQAMQNNELYEKLRAKNVRILVMCCTYYSLYVCIYAAKDIMYSCLCICM